MQVRFGELTKTELSEARTYLESQQSGLGCRFNHDVREAVARIARIFQSVNLYYRVGIIWLYSVSFKRCFVGAGVFLSPIT